VRVRVEGLGDCLQCGVDVACGGLYWLGLLLDVIGNVQCCEL
jgi:hypothetical protein